MFRLAVRIALLSILLAPAARASADVPDVWEAQGVFDTPTYPCVQGELLARVDDKLSPLRTEVSPLPACDASRRIDATWWIEPRSVRGEVSLSFERPAVVLEALSHEVTHVHTFPVWRAVAALVDGEGGTAAPIALEVAASTGNVEGTSIVVVTSLVHVSWSGVCAEATGTLIALVDGARVATYALADASSFCGSADGQPSAEAILSPTRRALLALDRPAIGAPGAFAGATARAIPTLDGAMLQQSADHPFATPDALPSSLEEGAATAALMVEAEEDGSINVSASHDLRLGPRANAADALGEGKDGTRPARSDAPWAATFSAPPWTGPSVDEGPAPAAGQEDREVPPPEPGPLRVARIEARDVDGQEGALPVLFLYALLVVAALALYQRMSRDGAVRHPARAALLAAAAASGGGTAAQLAARAGLNVKTAEYHLTYLCRANILLCDAPEDGPRVFRTPATRSAPSLTDGVAAAVAHAPGVDLATLAAKLGTSRGRVDRRVKDLVLAGVIACRVVDGRRCVFPA